MKPFYRLASIFNNFSLHKKIFYSYFFLFFLLISILSVFICTVMASSLRKRNTFSLQQNFDQAVSYLSYKLDEISSTSDMLIYNISLNSILNQENNVYRSGQQQLTDSKEILHLLIFPRRDFMSLTLSPTLEMELIFVLFPRQRALFGGIHCL